MEESKVQALHDTLSKLKKSQGLGVSSHYNFGKVKTTEVDGKIVREDGLPNNPLYFPFVREGTYDRNKSDAAKYGDGRVIKRNFDDCNSDSESGKKKSKEERKAEKKAAKLEAKRQAKLEEKRRAKREEKRLAKLNSTVSETTVTDEDKKAKKSKKRKVSDSDKSDSEAEKKKAKKSKKSKKSKSWHEHDVAGR